VFAAKYILHLSNCYHERLPKWCSSILFAAEFLEILIFSVNNIVCNLTIKEQSDDLVFVDVFVMIQRRNS